ncbi:MAG: flavodoxin family protein, partial [Alphaproteobacteria bacterium]
MAGTRRILILQGHPDHEANHFCHALGNAYAAGAREAGHSIRQITVAQIDFPILRNQAEFSGPVPDMIKACQDDVEWADHLVIVYPLWLGTMPALLKAFFEQLLRPGFAFSGLDDKGRWRKNLQGKSAHVVISMGMPAFIYRHVFR